MPPSKPLAGTAMWTVTFCGVVFPAAHVPMMQFAGQVSAGFGCTLGLFSSTVLPSSQVSLPSTVPLPHAGWGSVVVVDGGWSCATTAATHSSSTTPSTAPAAPAQSLFLVKAALNLSSAFERQAESTLTALAVALALQLSFAAAFFPAALSFAPAHLPVPGTRFAMSVTQVSTVCSMSCGVPVHAPWQSGFVNAACSFPSAFARHSESTGRFLDAALAKQPRRALAFLPA